MQIVFRELGAEALDEGVRALSAELAQWIDTEVARERARNIAACLSDGVEDPERICRELLVRVLSHVPSKARQTIANRAAIAWGRATWRYRL